MDVKEDNITFEEAIDKIEAIIGEMESGRLKLEKSIERFEEGMKLVKFCQDKLDKYEASVKTILDNKEGRL